MASRPFQTVETPAVAVLPGGPLEYMLRRSPRARGLRVTIDPARGVIVTIPAAGARGWARGEGRVLEFLTERESWVRKHVEKQQGLRRELAARGGIRDGASVRFRGELHRLHIEAPGGGPQRSSVIREGDLAGDRLVVRLGTTDRRDAARVMTDWCRDRARESIERAVEAHAPALAVQPAGIAIRDQRTRWGSASRERRLSFSWRLILAPPEALETVVIHELVHLRIFGHGPHFWDLVASRRPDHIAWRRWLQQHAFELHAAFEPLG
jgi:predicted metal-dependent hydrolase